MWTTIAIIVVGGIVLWAALKPPKTPSTLRRLDTAAADSRFVHVHEPNFAPHEHALIGIGRCRVATTIEYVDIAGHASRRAIDIHEVTCAPSGWIYLESYCHQAKAARSFRADHVKAFIDGDGVVTEPRSFVIDILKVPLLKSAIRARAR